MTFPRKIKDPQAVLNYDWDWRPWLAPDDTLTDATFTAPPGLTIQSSSFLTGGVATVWLADGEPRTDYVVTCEITTAAGLIDNRSVTIACKEQ